MIGDKQQQVARCITSPGHYGKCIMMRTMDMHEAF